MADKKISKEVKRQRVTKAEKKRNASYEKIIDILSDKNPREQITLFKAESEKPLGKKNAIGTMRCPLCSKHGIFVANHGGSSGKPEDDYIMRHNGQNGYMCKASLTLTRNYF